MKTFIYFAPGFCGLYIRAVFIRRIIGILTMMFFLSFEVIPFVSSAQMVLSEFPSQSVSTAVFLFRPMLVSGMAVDPSDPLALKFYIDSGDEEWGSGEGDTEGSAGFQVEAQKLIGYFLAALTVPDDQMWVNLSPAEPDRIIADGLGRTEMGRDMLAQDYLLKQLTASLMSPEGEAGKKFWEKVYEKIYEDYNSPQPSFYTKRGSAESSRSNPPSFFKEGARGSYDQIIESFNKVWIVPEHASVYVHDNNVFIAGSHLKVMMEEDYFMQNVRATHESPEKNTAGVHSRVPLQDDIKSIIRSAILPLIEDEINNGETFANLRQIYNSMILAAWYKRNLKRSLLTQAYADKNLVEGIGYKEYEIGNKEIETEADGENRIPYALSFTPEQIYQDYLSAFRSGASQIIREEYNPVTQAIVPRQYFTGGLEGVHHVNNATLVPEVQANYVVFVGLRPEGGDPETPPVSRAMMDAYKTQEQERLKGLISNAAYVLNQDSDERFHEADDFLDLLKKNPYILKDYRLFDLMIERKIQDGRQAAELIKAFYLEGKKCEMIRTVDEDDKPIGFGYLFHAHPYNDPRSVPAQQELINSKGGKEKVRLFGYESTTVFFIVTHPENRKKYLLSQIRSSEISESGKIASALGGHIGIDGDPQMTLLEETDDEANVDISKLHKVSMGKDKRENQNGFWFVWKHAIILDAEQSRKAFEQMKKKGGKIFWLDTMEELKRHLPANQENPDGFSEQILEEMEKLVQGSTIEKREKKYDFFTPIPLIREYYKSLQSPKEAFSYGEANFVADDRLMNQLEGIVAKNDNAALQKPGGIDFDAAQLDLRESGQRMDFDFSQSGFDPAQLQKAGGLKPWIKRVVPLTPAMLNHLLSRGSFSDNENGRLSNKDLRRNMIGQFEDSTVLATSAG